MSTPPPAKRTKIGSPKPISPKPSAFLLSQQASTLARPILDTIPPPAATSSRNKRPRSSSPASEARMLDLKPPVLPVGTSSSADISIAALTSPATPGRPEKKSRTNTPWSAAEEQRLKQMRDAGNTWSEIAKAFPNRTEGSVKKHWYKDMHYAEFAEDETKALLEAIREYEANKWKVIGAKLGKPAKACEQFAKDHFKSL